MMVTDKMSYRPYRPYRPYSPYRPYPLTGIIFNTRAVGGVVWRGGGG